MRNEGIVISQISSEEIGIILKGSLETLELAVMVQRDSGIFDVPAYVDHLECKKVA